MQKYRAVSHEIFEIFRRNGRAVEGLSMDEAFVDTGEETLETARDFAAMVRREINAATQLTVSAGVASGKMVAKIASDTCKPDGLLAIAPGEEAAFLAPLPVARLWGIGPKMQARLDLFGITTIGELAAFDDARLRELFGSWWREVRDLASGVDRRPVETGRETKSISTEETFEYDVRDENRLVELLREQARELAGKIERGGLQCANRRDKDQTRRLLDCGTADASCGADARSAADLSRRHLLLRRAALDGAPVRLLGTRVASLVPGDATQIVCSSCCACKSL